MATKNQQQLDEHELGRQESLPQLGLQAAGVIHPGQAAPFSKSPKPTRLTRQSTSAKETNLMPRLLICLITAGALAGTAAASSTARWTTVGATAKLKATWTTVDPKAQAAVQEHIDQELAGGRLPTDPVVLQLQGDLRRTLHAAHVTAAHCAGVGKAVQRRYSRFHCTATVTGTDRTPPDRQYYTATVKLTVTTAHGFVVKTGWR